MTIYIRVQTADFDITKEYAALRQDSSCGAVVTFSGLVRELNDARLHTMTLEHYPGMTEQTLGHIAQDAQTRWQLGAITIIHRVGELRPNDQIVFVGVASAHRAAAFCAAEFIMDYLKTRAPFWKKEHTQQGSYWVDAKTSDEQSSHRWSN
jgi:molybdopterin synthase catalytic subunit